jgi:hypothetical protein
MSLLTLRSSPQSSLAMPRLRKVWGDSPFLKELVTYQIEADSLRRRKPWLFRRTAKWCQTARNVF